MDSKTGHRNTRIINLCSSTRSTFLWTERNAVPSKNELWGAPFALLKLDLVIQYEVKSGGKGVWMGLSDTASIASSFPLVLSLIFFIQFLPQCIWNGKRQLKSVPEVGMLGSLVMYWLSELIWKMKIWVVEALSVKIKIHSGSKPCGMRYKEREACGLTIICPENVGCWPPMQWEAGDQVCALRRREFSLGELYSTLVFLDKYYSM